MKKIIVKVLVFLHFMKAEPQLIKLTKYDKMWIKLLKNHYANDERYHVNASSWIETLKPMFREIYGYEPDENLKSFRFCIHRKLFKLWYKIDPRMIQDNIDWKCDILLEILKPVFSRSIVRDYEESVDRLIAELCGQIQCTLVISRDGSKRFDLDTVEDDI